MGFYVDIAELQKTQEAYMKMVVTAQSQLDTALQKWMDKGGKVEILEDGTWAYTNSEGITIKYIEGFSDFKNGIPPQVKKEFVLFIKQVKNYLANLARCLELYLIWVLMEIELLVRRQKQRQRKVKI